MEGISNDILTILDLWHVAKAIMVLLKYHSWCLLWPEKDLASKSVMYHFDTTVFWQQSYTLNSSYSIAYLIALNTYPGIRNSIMSGRDDLGFSVRAHQIITIKLLTQGSLEKRFFPRRHTGQLHPDKAGDKFGWRGSYFLSYMAKVVKWLFFCSDMDDEYWWFSWTCLVKGSMPGNGSMENTQP